MNRLTKDLRCWTDLHNAARVHHRDLIGELGHNGKVVTYVNGTDTIGTAHDAHRI